ncbi:MAG: hypothetical protein LBV57_04865 [Candidatus Symbiothrix sp.]|jgi:hypothetical protein|nr:hypothetical protein [Candidatus Symbiothrix sp.]
MKNIKFNDIIEWIIPLLTVLLILFFSWLFFGVVGVSFVVIWLMLWVFGFWGIAKGLEDRYPYDKYDLLMVIANENRAFQHLRAVFISNAKDKGIINDEEIFVYKAEGNQSSTENYMIFANLNNLIYPSKEYDSFVCPHCGGNVFWILSYYGNGDYTVKYMAICPQCTCKVNDYDESIYHHKKVFKRIDNLKNNNDLISQVKTGVVFKKQPQKHYIKHE